MPTACDSLDAVQYDNNTKIMRLKTTKTESRRAKISGANSQPI